MLASCNYEREKQKLFEKFVTVKVPASVVPFFFLKTIMQNFTDHLSIPSKNGTSLFDKFYKFSFSFTLLDVDPLMRKKEIIVLMLSIILLIKTSKK